MRQESTSLNGDPIEQDPQSDSPVDRSQDLDFEMPQSLGQEANSPITQISQATPVSQL